MASENGWEPSRASASQCVWRRVPGAEHVSLQLLSGVPSAIMMAFAADYHAFVEPLRDPDSCGYTPTNSVATSNHLNGTAFDLNWNSHPFKVKGTFTANQQKAFRELQDFYEGTIFWAGDWRSPIDEMHWQMNYGTYGNQQHCRDFIARKIRADGFSTFRRQGSPGGSAQLGLTAETLHYIMRNPKSGQSPLSVSDYARLLPHVKKCLIDCEANNFNRVSMWFAQMGHESEGLYYRSEIWGPTAAQRGYEGRKDLGNIVPGDGYRYRGRGFIQVTGRHNYSRFSEWAYRNKYVDKQNYFVDNPDALLEDKFAFLSVVWYWTYERPDINSLSDAQNIVAVTQRINGGQNGIGDRRSRYGNARAVGWDRINPQVIGGFLMALTDAQQAELYAQICGKRASKSIYADPNEPPRWTAGDYAQNMDKFEHEDYVEKTARKGNLNSIRSLARTAAGAGAVKDDWAINQAADVLKEIYAVNPEYIEAAK